MIISEILIKMPWWYLLLALLISLYYGIRGIIEHSVLHLQGKSYISNIDKAKRIIILYIQDFLFKFITAMSGFVALFIAGCIFPSMAEINDISVGKALLLIFLFVWGVIGVGGYLTLLIATGKFPHMK